MSRRSRLLLLAAAVSVLAAAAVVGVLVVRDGGGGGDDHEVRLVAGRFGEALLTYDHEDPERHRDAVLDLATGGFRNQYEEAFDGGLSDVITELDASSRAFTTDVFLSTIDAGTAEAIVVVDVERDGAGGPRTVRDIYFQLSLVEVAGQWRVDDVVDLNLNLPTDPRTGPDVSGSTTTSVP